MNRIKIYYMYEKCHTSNRKQGKLALEFKFLTVTQEHTNWFLKMNY